MVFLSDKQPCLLVIYSCFSAIWYIYPCSPRILYTSLLSLQLVLYMSPVHSILSETSISNTSSGRRERNCFGLQQTHPINNTDNNLQDDNKRSNRTTTGFPTSRKTPFWRARRVDQWDPIFTTIPSELHFSPGVETFPSTRRNCGTTKRVGR